MLTVWLLIGIVCSVIHIGMVNAWYLGEGYERTLGDKMFLLFSSIVVLILPIGIVATFVNFSEHGVNYKGLFKRC